MNSSLTVLEAVALRLRATAEGYHVGVEEAPVAILWTDPEGCWKPLVTQLQNVMPELLVLGNYAPEKRTGPVIWLKCAMAGKIPEVVLPPGQIPVLYLPGVSRHVLRNADQCPWAFQPLVELLYRGTVWSHPNGRDWSLEAFFQAKEGLGLEVATDEATKLSLRSALSALAKTPVAQLIGRSRLEAGDFDAIVVGDTPRDLLTWVGAPDAVRQEWGEERWHAFRSRCQDSFGFDPEKETPLFAAEKLGRKETDRWSRLWDRFCEAPALYEGVRGALDRAQPADQLALDAEAWPAENQKREDELRAALSALAHQPPHAARQTLNDLEKQHAGRRGWVWARLGEAPLAISLVPLRQLAESTRVVPTCETADEMVRWYVEAGWRADAAVLDALRSLRNHKDEAALHQAIRSVYAAWMEDVARRYQALVVKSGYASPGGEQAAEGECLLFVDGLRFDVGQSLAGLLEQANLKVERATRLAALPSVTPTAKPAVAPIAAQCGGKTVPPNFRPNGPDGSELTTHHFGKLLEAGSYQRLKEGEPLGPMSAAAKGWMETGRIDSRGHDLGAELASQIPNELQRVVALVESLLGAGWSHVRIITDHGWLLLPGGLAKHELPGFLLESRWARCAAIKGRSTPDIPTVAWRWNAGEHVVVAPGARSFKKGEAYAHGGVSLQECVTPILRVSAGAEKAGGTVRIAELRWKRMRCAVELDHGAAGLRADVRLVAADVQSSVVAAVKEIEADGQVSLLIKEEDFFGKPATVVILDRTGAVVAKRETKIGG
jgi:hypothetical protein